jgi:signal transduction histidine kinase
MKAAQRGERLVRQLLTYTRKQITHPETVNPNQLIVDIENLMSQVIGEQIEVVTMLSPVLAPAQIDPAQFETAILNLVINSRDAMMGGGRITIETRNVTLDRRYATSSGRPSTSVFLSKIRWTISRSIRSAQKSYGSNSFRGKSLIPTSNNIPIGFAHGQTSLQAQVIASWKSSEAT